MFDSQIVSTKENKYKWIWFSYVWFYYNFFKLKLVINLYILKLFNFYIIEEIKWNDFEETYKNNFLILNLIFIFLHFFISQSNIALKLRRELLFSCMKSLWVTFYWYEFFWSLLRFSSSQRKWYLFIGEGRELNFEFLISSWLIQQI